MIFRWNPREHLQLAKYFGKWCAITLPVGAIIGSACALFLGSLNVVTQARWDHPWLLYFLPMGGVAIGLLYHWFGRSVESGNNLLMEEIHEPGGGVPRRMAPLILIGTIVTHLFGGSAGREGTAIQMGGSLASGFAKLFGLRGSDLRTLLTAGIAAGFSGVFGTPIAGTIFALEVLTIGRMNYEALLPCLLAAIVSDWVCAAWGIHHTQYHLADLVNPGLLPESASAFWWLFAKVLVAGSAFGLASACFAELTHGLKRFFTWAMPLPYLRPALGGLLVIVLVYLVGTRDYLGLGVTGPSPDSVTILSSFHAGGAHGWSWWWKTVFTAVTLGSGFKGGEVTPLFYIGATLGNILATLLSAPQALFAAIGFVSIFAGATNTPLACTVMAIELFGPTYAIYYAAGCFIAYLFSGHSGIYSAQRLGTPKIP
ncbi:MAG: voltage-gated chloride channel family protein [Deltaproteobacteria bacterium]|nr:voltage-gated chloride channel family protein [Deltaproteobacteria bacterium]